MKKLLFAASLFFGILAFAPDAEAGGYRERYIRYYDHCGRPVYGYIYRDDGCYDRRVTYYRRPARVYYRDYDYCAPRVRYYSSRPRFSVFLGF